MATQAMILLAHGSRDPAWREPFEAVAARLTKDAGKGRVRLAYLQFCPPALTDALTAAADEGFESIEVLPLFLSAGGHVRKDIPAQIEAARAASPAAAAATIKLLPTVGEDPRFGDLLAAIAAERFGGSSGEALC